MTKARALAPLVAFSLGHNRLPFAGVVLWPLYLFSFLSTNPYSHLEAAPWPLLLLVAMSSKFLLAPVKLGAGAVSLEFWFTRAIDRRRLLRVVVTAYLILTACPLVVALGTAAAFRPQLVVVLQDETKAVRYLSAFPDSYVTERWPDVVHLALPRGRTMAAAVACWDCALYIVLYQGPLFWSLRGRRARRVADAIAPFIMIGMISMNSVVASSWLRGVHEEETLFFASHPAPFVLSFVMFALIIAFAYAPYERRFQRLEVW